MTFSGVQCPDPYTEFPIKVEIALCSAFTLYCNLDSHRLCILAKISNDVDKSNIIPVVKLDV
jgi:hypothetical protein